MADVGDVSFVPLLFVFVAHLFVLPGVSSKICAPVDHDIAVLKDQPFWYFEQDHNVSTCLPFKPQELNVTSTCIFYFSICQPVPSFCPDNTGICLSNKLSFLPKYKKTLYTEFKSIGRFNDEFVSEANYFTLEFGPGDPIDPLLSPSTVLEFRCDEKAIWNKTADGRVTFPPSVAFSEITGQYVMVFNYSGACYGGGGGGGGKGGGEPARALSVGSIMLILFFPGLFLYCVVGALINKGAGKSGKELMPHSKFWSNLPGLISDGFSFTIAKITCTEMSSTRETYNPM